jgi:hypothetical protein
MSTILHIKHGFKLENVFFGWLDGELYQLPYEYNNRYFGLRKIKLKRLKNGWEFYRIRRKAYGIAKVRAMLQEVHWEVSKPLDI